MEKEVTGREQGKGGVWSKEGFQMDVTRIEGGIGQFQLDGTDISLGVVVI